MANLDIFERENLVDHVKATAPAFRTTLEKLLDLPIVGDVRGAATSTGSSWSRTRPRARRSTPRNPNDSCSASFPKVLFEAGLYCRADDRGDPVVQLAPPPICGQSEFDEMEQILRDVLTEAWSHVLRQVRHTAKEL